MNLIDYRLYFCDSQGRFFAVHDFTTRDDQCAIDYAKKTAPRKSPAFEVWHRDRLIYREGETAALGSVVQAGGSARATFNRVQTG